MIALEDLKKLFELTLSEENVTQHIKRAYLDYEGLDFTKHEDLELEIVGSKALFYLSPHLWVDMQNRTDEYEESLSTFKDVEKFGEYWLKRADSALQTYYKRESLNSKQSYKSTGGLQWACP